MRRQACAISSLDASRRTLSNWYRSTAWHLRQAWAPLTYTDQEPPRQANPVMFSVLREPGPEP